MNYESFRFLKIPPLFQGQSLTVDVFYGLYLQIVAFLLSILYICAVVYINFLLQIQKIDVSRQIISLLTINQV